MDIRAGQVITFKPEFMDDGDAEIIFVALEDSSVSIAGGPARVLVQAQSRLPIQRTEIVSVDWIANAADVG